MSSNKMPITQGGVVYATATQITTSAAGTTGQYLQSNGSGAPGWGAPISGLTTNTFPIATSSTTIGNSLLTYSTGGGEDDYIYSSVASANIGVIIQPVSTNRSAAFVLRNSANTNNVGYILDATTAYNRHPGQVMWVTGGSATSFYWYNATVNTMSLDNLGNLTAGGNIAAVQVGANLASQLITQPLTSGYASYSNYRNSGNTASVYCGLDGTGLGQVPAGDGVLAHSDGTKTIWIGGGGTAWYGHTSSNITVQGTRGITFNGGAQFQYEEGSWTPALSFLGGGPTISGTFTGTFIRSGKYIYLTMNAAYSYTGNGVVGNLIIQGLPYNMGVSWSISGTFDGTSLADFPGTSTVYAGPYFATYRNVSSLFVYSPVSGTTASANPINSSNTGTHTGQLLLGGFSYSR